MNSSLCEEFIHYLDRDKALNCDGAPEYIQTWIGELDLPEDLAHFMRHSWPQNDGYLSHIRLHSSTSLYNDEATALLLKCGFMNAGAAPNGDWFVIDFSMKVCVPGFIPLGEWSPAIDDPPNPRIFFQPIARSFDSFLYRVVEGRYLPTDSYAAKNLNAFLAGEKNA